MALNVGLDIGTTAVRAAAIQTGKGTPILRRYGQVALPEGAVVGGEIVERDVVQAAIAQLFKTTKLPKRRVVVGVANQRVIVRRIDVPYMAEDELREALPFQAQEYIPIPVEEAILDFVPLEEFSTPTGEAMLSVLVVAAHKEMAAEVVETVETAGPKVQALDLQAFALVRSVYGGDLNLDADPDVILDIGGDITQLVIVKAGTVRFLRYLSTGGRDFTTRIVEALDVDRPTAESLKRRIGVALDGLPEGDDEETVARRVLTEQADVLIDDVRGSIEYYLGQSDDEVVRRILVAGNGARLPHLANRIGRRIGVPIEPIRILGGDRIEVGKTGLSEAELLQAQPVLPVSIGLALWGEI